MAFAFLSLLGSPAFAQMDASDKQLPNFHPVNENLYRGGQPATGAVKKLKELGIKTIVNLRDDDGHAVAEEAEAGAAGLRYVNVPMSNFSRPNDKTVGRVLAIINERENQPVFVHCKRGSDRTGAIIAVYRMEHDGWTSEQAKAEAKRYGLGFWQVKIKDYISDYFKRRSNHTKTPTLTPSIRRNRRLQFAF